MSKLVVEVCWPLRAFVPKEFPFTMMGAPVITLVQVPELIPIGLKVGDGVCPDAMPIMAAAIRTK
jgi:hypothetical protein